MRNPVTGLLDVSTNEDQPLDTLELAFHSRMVSIYERARSEAQYTATRFIQMVAEYGGVEAARRILHIPDASDGWNALWEKGRLDLWVECQVLDPQFHQLFTGEERSAARKWLLDYGFDPEEWYARHGNPG
jgi:hypothetical protein